MILTVSLNMRKTILLVDDDQDDIDLFKEALEIVSKDAKLVTVNNGKEALDLVLDQKITLDHIFLDINMPVMSGVECLEELSRRKKIPPPEITIYTTSVEGFKGYDRCIELGAKYLRKPSTYGGLIETLKTRLMAG
jgi:CheY-like chemotaxis protein